MMNTNITKKIPVGIDDFKELIEKFYFVDKSHFIAGVLDNYHQVSIINRPRRFGKSLMLSMLNYFFTIDDAENNRALFNDLKISKSDYMDRQGKSPVIFLSLNDIRADNFDSFVEQITILISNLYRKFSYILDSSIINEYCKDNFKKLCSKEVMIEELEVSLELLTKFLHTYHQKRVIVLIDDYDSPIINACDKKYYDDCIDFMRIFLGSCFKSNENLDFAVLTGITPMPREDYFICNFDNFTIYSVIDSEFNDVFGFTEEEVAKFLNYYHIDDKIEEVNEWYDGYYFNDKKIYNPWSIVNYISDNCTNNFQNKYYWINTSDNSILNLFFHNSDINLKESFKRLICHYQIDEDIDEYISYNEKDRNTYFYSMLVATGYLKVINKTYDYCWSCSLTIPNKEIYVAYKDAIYDNLSDTCRPILKIVANALISGNELTFIQEFKNLLVAFISSFDITKDLQANFYYGLFFALFYALEEDYIIESNEESGCDSFAICCIPKDANNHGIILEFKASKSTKSLNKDATQALKEITALKYTTIFAKYSSKYSVNNIWQYGIAFYKRDFVIKKKDT